MEERHSARTAESQGLPIAVGAILIGSVEVAKAAEQRVEWTNLVNVAVRGNALQKNRQMQWVR
jgi:hypothetical protein